ADDRDFVGTRCRNSQHCANGEADNLTYLHFDSFCERRVHVLPLVRSAVWTDSSRGELGLLAVSPNLFPPGEYEKAAVNLPPVAESKTELGRRRISLVDRS